MINDEDIDTELPSTDGLSPSDQEEFFEPDNLIANINLAKISGQIINGSDINGLKRAKS
jgi:proline utilization trans-activator